MINNKIVSIVSKLFYKQNTKHSLFVLPSFVLCDSKLNIFGLWTVSLPIQLTKLKLTFHILCLFGIHRSKTDSSLDLKPENDNM